MNKKIFLILVFSLATLYTVYNIYDTYALLETDEIVSNDINPNLGIIICAFSELFPIFFDIFLKKFLKNLVESKKGCTFASA